ncbi:MAG: Hsp20/alpha crystallin family protein [Parvularculaceae bacterium]
MTKLMKSPSSEARGWLDPFDALHDDVERFFGGRLKRFPFPQIGFRGDGEGRLFANLDIGETGDELVVEIDAPGVKREDIEITITDSALRIKGKRESLKEEKAKSFYRSEREYGEFDRRIGLPCEVDANRIDAALMDGVLTIRLPKSAKAKEQERKIEIHA